MNLPLFLAALLLSASPALADGILFLKCDETRVFTTKSHWRDGDTTHLENEDKEVLVLGIDRKKETMLINNSEVDIVIKNDEAIDSGTFDNGKAKDTRVIHTTLSPPYTRYGNGKVVIKEDFVTTITDVAITADCTKIDFADFEKFLNQ